MKRLLSCCLIGASLSLSLAGCERAKAPAPTEAPAFPLQKIDNVTGIGKEAVDGAEVVVNYAGWIYDPNAAQQRGAQFDSSVGRSPFTFELGAGQVIPGWDQGVKGMKVGGKRTLIVPAALGYGSRGIGPIPPNSNLIFDVELLDVK
ncbi:FKBP-type peptidyl-prolyl cis-trans isomerase [Pseudoduganella sp. OTU4001]|uniref:FKBP-type peptidyl-prolyl cis-trans isomerase n=1 Tax=Pseudoduganella sp. OTU4001 TaxID=3043854 RepID=UPI00313D7EE4